MKVVYFTHSLISCWNHGNAHFLRGVLRELKRRGHKVDVFEPEAGWSLRNLLGEHGRKGLAAYEAAYPDLSSRAFDSEFDLAEAVEGADLVIVHEWNDPALVAQVGKLRARGGRFTLLFHDTHHRAVSEPKAMQAYDLSAYDGVLAFGEALAEVYRSWGWGARAFVWHEAADVTHFRPPEEETDRHGLVWIGNWGDGERSTELETFLLEPAKRAGLPLDIYGVRYPAPALAMLASHGAQYRGWAPNARAPEIFARHMATAHVPRRFYAKALPGIPTIRVFEALACGIPLVSAPWDDAEGLFRRGEDFLMAGDGAEMGRLLTKVKADGPLRAALVRSGLETVRARHTCAHRVDELLAMVRRLQAPSTSLTESAA
jgi:spore maturation protein CgeB